MEENKRNLEEPPEKKPRKFSLIKAVRDNNLKDIEEFLKQSKYEGLTDNCGWTAVHHAAYYGRLQILQLLLENSICESQDVKNTTWTGETPLLIACKSPKVNPDVVQYLLFKNSDVRHANNFGQTALHFTCELSGNLKVARMLRDMGADVMAEAGESTLPLCCAIKSRNKKFVQYLLRQGKYNKRHLNSAIQYAIIYLPDILSDLYAMIKCKPSSSHMKLGFRSFQAFDELLRLGGDPEIQLLNLTKWSSFCVWKKYFQEYYQASPDEDYMQRYLVKLLKKNDHTDPLLETITSVFESRKPSFKIDPSNLPANLINVTLKYFPSHYENHEMLESLQDRCRVVYRGMLADQLKGPYKAFLYLKDSNLPSSIKSFLLYDDDIPQDEA